MPQYETVGERVRRLRLTAGLSLTDLALLSRLSRMGIWKIETGRREPQLVTLRKLANGLNVELSELLE